LGKGPTKLPKGLRGGPFFVVLGTGEKIRAVEKEKKDRTNPPEKKSDKGTGGEGGPQNGAVFYASHRRKEPGKLRGLHFRRGPTRERGTSKKEKGGDIFF